MNMGYGRLRGLVEKPKKSLAGWSTRGIAPETSPKRSVSSAATPSRKIVRTCCRMLLFWSMAMRLIPARIPRKGMCNAESRLDGSHLLPESIDIQ